MAYQYKTSLPVLGRDIKWKLIENQFCRVDLFYPIASIENDKILVPGSTPYAALTIECANLSTKAIWLVAHKVDFIHLWEAFKERGVKENEEVLIIISSKRHNFLYKIISFIMPKIFIMIYPRGSFEKFNNPEQIKQLTGEQFYRETKPIKSWEPIDSENRFFY